MFSNVSKSFCLFSLERYIVLQHKFHKFRKNQRFIISNVEIGLQNRNLGFVGTNV